MKFDSGLTREMLRCAQHDNDPLSMTVLYIAALWRCDSVPLVVTHAATPGCHPERSEVCIAGQRGAGCQCFFHGWSSIWCSYSNDQGCVSFWSLFREGRGPALHMYNSFEQSLGVSASSAPLSRRSERSACYASLLNIVCSDYVSLKLSENTLHVLSLSGANQSQQRTKIARSEDVISFPLRYTSSVKDLTGFRTRRPIHAQRSSTCGFLG
jgi:hypothetical protein